MSCIVTKTAEAEVEVDLTEELDGLSTKEFNELWAAMLEERDRRGSGLKMTGTDMGRVADALRLLRAGRPDDALHELEAAFCPLADPFEQARKYAEWKRVRDAKTAEVAACA